MNEFQPNSCFLYYTIFALVLIMLTWVSILYGYSSEKVNSWIMWKYTAHGIVPYLFWTVAALLFTVAAFHGDCRNIIKDQLYLYRFLFFTILILNILSFFLFFVQHNTRGALIAQIFILVLTLGLIFLYSGIDIDDAWYCYPYLVATIYFIYCFMHVHNMNNTLSHDMIPDILNF